MCKTSHYCEPSLADCRSRLGAGHRANTGGSVTTTTTAYYGGVAESVNGALSYTLSDGLGSVSESVSASTGTASATQLYGPYGAARYTSGTLPTDYAFTHQRADATSGLDYYGARYYDPVAGQCSSADTVQAGGLNRYGYVDGNPETRTDPTGHRYTCPVSSCGSSGIGGTGESAGGSAGLGGSSGPS